MRNDKIAIIGLGYVGLPSHVFTKFSVGYDINDERILELMSGLVPHWKLMKNLNL